MKRVAFLGVLVFCGCAGELSSPTGIDEQEIGDSGGVKGFYASDKRSEGAMVVVSFDGNAFTGLLCVTSRCRDEELVLVTGDARFNPLTPSQPDRKGLLRIDANFVAGVDPDTTCPALSYEAYRGPDRAPLLMQALLGSDNTLWLPDLCNGYAYPVPAVPQDSASAE